MAIPESGLVAIAVLFGLLLQLGSSPVRSLPELLALALPAGLSALVLIAFGATLLGIEGPTAWAALVGVALAASCAAAARPLAELGARRQLWLAAGVTAIAVVAVALESLHAAYLSREAHLLFAATDAIFFEDLIGMVRLGARFETGLFALYLGSYRELCATDYLVTLAPLATASAVGAMCLAAHRTAVRCRLSRRAAIGAAVLPLLLCAASFPMIQAAFRQEGHPLAASLLLCVAACAWLVRLDQVARWGALGLLVAGAAMSFEFAPVVIALWLAVGLADRAAESRRLPMVIALGTVVCLWAGVSALADKTDGFAALLPLGLVAAGVAVRGAWARWGWRPFDWIARAGALGAVIAALLALDHIGQDVLFRFDIWGAPFALGTGLTIWGIVRAPRSFLPVAVWASAAIVYCVWETDISGKLPPEKTLVIAAMLLVLSAAVMVPGAIARLGVFGGAGRATDPIAAPAEAGPLHLRRLLGVLVALLLSLHIVTNLVVLRSNTRRLSVRYRVWPPHNHFDVDHLELK